MNARRCRSLRHTWKEAVRDDALGPQRTQRSSRATVRAVAVALYDRMNDDGRCWPSMRLLAADTGLHPRSCRDVVLGLERDGWLRVRRTRGRSRPNVYQATFPTLVTTLMAAIVAGEALPPAVDYVEPRPRFCCPECGVHYPSEELMYACYAAHPLPAENRADRPILGPKNRAVRHAKWGGPPSKESIEESNDGARARTSPSALFAPPPDAPSGAPPAWVYSWMKATWNEPCGA